jgi:hypothetical protein
VSQVLLCRETVVLDLIKDDQRIGLLLSSSHGGSGGIIHDARDHDGDHDRDQPPCCRDTEHLNIEFMLYAYCIVLCNWYV